MSSSMYRRRLRRVRVCFNGGCISNVEAIKYLDSVASGGMAGNGEHLFNLMLLKGV